MWRLRGKYGSRDVACLTGRPGLSSARPSVLSTLQAAWRAKLLSAPVQYAAAGRTSVVEPTEVAAKAGARRRLRAPVAGGAPILRAGAGGDLDAAQQMRPRRRARLYPCMFFWTGLVRVCIRSRSVSAIYWEQAKHGGGGPWCVWAPAAISTGHCFGQDGGAHLPLSPCFHTVRSAPAISLRGGRHGPESRNQSGGRWGTR